MAEVCKLLNRLVKIYQIPNIDNEAIVYLSEFVMEEYKHHDFELILEALKYPQRNRDNTWRLTPDTIRFWVESTQEKRFDRTQKQESQKRQETVNTNFEQLSPETQKLVADYIASLMPAKTTYQMTKQEIQEEGQTRPKRHHRSTYNSTPKEELIMKELKRQYYLECYDKYTGKPLDNWMSFEEWVKI